MTADDAAQSWFQRAGEILETYKATGPSATLWQQSDVAANGAQALLENRYNELSTDVQGQLQRTIDSMAEVKRKSVGEAMGSPLSDAAEEFYDEVHRRAIAGGAAVAKAGKQALAGGLAITAVLLIAYAILVLKR